MDISNITSQAQAALQQSTSAGSGDNKMGQQNFLQLLVAQMRHQDPINPMKGTEFASQLAQFNSVEQLINVNSGLKSLQDSQDMMSSSLTNTMAASLTGKQIRALSDQVHLPAGDEAKVNFELNNSAEKVEIVIRNASGSEVRRETLEGVASGDNSWIWDGRNNSGERMGDGDYTVEVNATNGDDSIKSKLFIEGVAEKVRYTGQGVFLSVGDVQVPIGDVEEVGTGIF